MKSFKIIFATSLFLLSTYAHAVVINGLDWLSLSETRGQSLSDALGANAGYRLASETEFHDMFSLYEDPNDNLFVNLALDSTLSTPTITQSLSGYTKYQAQGDSSWSTNSFSTDFDSILLGGASIYTLGFYQDQDSLDVYRMGGVQVVNNFEDTAIDTAYTFYDYNISYTDIGGLLYGWFLVMDDSTPPSAIPEPSILALMGLGLVGLGFARRRRLHRQG